MSVLPAWLTSLDENPFAPALARCAAHRAAVAAIPGATTGDGGCAASSQEVPASADKEVRQRGGSAGLPTGDTREDEKIANAIAAIEKMEAAKKRRERSAQLKRERCSCKGPRLKPSLRKAIPRRTPSCARH